MKNVYEFGLKALCPVDGTLDEYEFSIEAPHTIEAEKIAAFIAASAERKVFQEDLTMDCINELGATRAISTGWHSGIKVRSEAP